MAGLMPGGAGNQARSRLEGRGLGHEAAGGQGNQARRRNGGLIIRTGSRWRTEDQVRRQLKGLVSDQHAAGGQGTKPEDYSLP